MASEVRHYGPLKVSHAARCAHVDDIVNLKPIASPDELVEYHTPHAVPNECDFVVGSSGRSGRDYPLEMIDEAL